MRSRPPFALLLPALVVAVGSALPLVYLLLRAFDADPAELSGIVLRPRNLWLLANTLKLVTLVLLIDTLIALPMAWLVTRSDLRHKRLVSFLMALPLAVPGYVMAYALLGLSGYYGFARQWLGVSLPPLHGLWGAGLALALYTFPYLFLNLRSALLGMDGALEESALSLGRSRAEVFRQILLPQLWPALVAGWLVVALYVIGDFGAIALMRYEVFSFAIYTQYSGAFDRTYAAWLCLMLLSLAAAALIAQRAVTRNTRLARTGTGTARPAAPVALGRLRWLVWVAIALVVLVSIGLPLLVLGHWMRLGLPQIDLAHLGQSALRSAAIAAPVAALSVALALPVALLTLRWPGAWSNMIERLAHLGYATPPLALALAMVMFSLQLVPALYQTRTLLIFALTISFLALAIGPIRLALLQIGSRQQEAARALGAGPGRAFGRVILPQLRRPMLAGGLLVFIMVAKELPITLLLAPTGDTTLAMTVFARTVEGMMPEAAPYALSLILFSALSVGLILNHESRKFRT